MHGSRMSPHRWSTRLLVAALATLLTLAATPAAGAAPSGSIAGTVRDLAGEPIEGICIYAGAGDIESGNFEGVSSTESGPDGSYVLQSLPPGSVRVVFEDCDGVGPFGLQWFRGATDLFDAEPIAVADGQAVVGVDVQLALTSVVSGTVTDTSGAPLADICVQASDADRVAGSTVTDEDGSYSLEVGAGGSYGVQFVDCTDEPTFGGRWYGGSVDPSTSIPVEVPFGRIVEGIDTQLSPALTAAVEGTVLNVRAEPMVGVCVVLYLAEDLARFAPVADDGSFRFDGAGSGTYAVGFLGCGDVRGDEEGDEGADVEPIITDPATGIQYRSLWWGDAVLDLDTGSAAPDPVAQGATLVTLTPGATSATDQCIGCSAIELDVQVDGDTAVAEVDPVGFAPAAARAQAQALQAAADPTIEYELSCAPTGGVVADTLQSASAADGPLRIEGLEAGARYECVATAVQGATLVATSTKVAVDGPDASDVPVTPGGGPAAAPVPAAPRALSFTG